MKKLVGFLGIILLANLTGCATEEYVRTQVNPLAERIDKVEARIGNLEKTVTQLVSMTEADRAAIKQADDKAQQALAAANKVEGGVQKAEAAAMKAEQSAKEAEQSARTAEKMGKKAEKIFNLEQKK